MKFLPSRRSLVIGSALPSIALALAGGPLRAAVVYTETFTNPSTETAASHASVGWSAHHSAGAVDVSTATSTSGSFTVTQASVGAKVNTGIGIAWTNEFGAIDRSVNEIATISFYSNNNSTASVARMAIQIGGSWYVTDETFTRNSTTAGTSSNWAENAEKESFAFTTAASSWRTLTFIPGTSLVLGAALTEPLPSGNITAAGIFFDSTSTSGRTIRYDNFEIAVVPEPASALMFSAGLSALALRRRRRRHHR